jgi:hypothetical protein
MIFIERPITVQHIRDACARFNEGLRVEYKSTFDANVRDQLPKVVSSFANSQGGVLVVGVRAVNGVPQPPFQGFVAQPREEFPLTVENICLRNIYPPVLPRVQVVESDAPNEVFLVIEVDESGEAPHAIENSRKVYVRTGNAANPYDFAEVDLIIDLLKRRAEPQARRERLTKFAQERSHQIVPQDQPFMRVVICPTFPRSPQCTAQQAWEFLAQTSMRDPHLIPYNSMKRIPDGAASFRLQDPRAPEIRPRYVELGSYGLLFLAGQFSVRRWAADLDDTQHLVFGDLFHSLVRLTGCAGRFYSAFGYSGSLIMNVSLHNVRGWAMRFFDPIGPFPDDPEDFRCHTHLVVAERLVAVEQIRVQGVDEVTKILTELTWAFWQSNAAHPTDQLRRHVEALLQ